MKKQIALLMALLMILTALPAYGADDRGRIAKIYFHIKKIGEDYTVVGRPSAENFPQYASGEKDSELVEHALYDYYFLETGVDEITGISYYDASGNLGPKVSLGQTEWSKYLKFRTQNIICNH